MESGQPGLSVNPAVRNSLVEVKDLALEGFSRTKVQPVVIVCLQLVSTLL